MRHNTKAGYSFVLHLLKKEECGYRKISSIKASDEDAIRKNPFVFKLTDVLVNDTVQRSALTEEETDFWMDYMSDNVYRALKRILALRPKVRTEPMVDGYTGFILLDKNGNPKDYFYDIDDHAGLAENIRTQA